MDNDTSVPKKPNAIAEKSFAFALRVVKLNRFLNSEKREHVMSKQLLRSGTAIGALVREAEHAESKPDFVHKLSIALKEANETDYWIELLHQSETISKNNTNQSNPMSSNLSSSS